MIRIFITEPGEEECEITAWMYWFEEQGVLDINDMQGHYRKYALRIEIDGKTIYKSEPK